MINLKREESTVEPHHPCVLTTYGLETKSFKHQISYFINELKDRMN